MRYSLNTTNTFAQPVHSRIEIYDELTTEQVPLVAIDRDGNPIDGLELFAEDAVNRLRLVGTQLERLNDVVGVAQGVVADSRSAIRVDAGARIEAIGTLDGGLGQDNVALPTILQDHWTLLNLESKTCQAACTLWACQQHVLGSSTNDSTDSRQVEVD